MCRAVCSDERSPSPSLGLGGAPTEDSLGSCLDASGLTPQERHMVMAVEAAANPEDLKLFAK